MVPPPTQAFPPKPEAALYVDAAAAGKAISPDLFGIFFEDLNYAADGGLYAELIQNRSFEYQAVEQPSWNSLAFWDLIKRGGGEGTWAVSTSHPLHPNNPHHLILEITRPGESVGVRNSGFDGIPLKEGEAYDVSFSARHLYTGGRWSKASVEGKPMPLILRLENPAGEVLAETALEVAGREWQRYSATLIPNRSEEAARFVLLAKARGGIALDEISLFPHNTFRGHRNGLRADLAQVIADLHPKFIRFPGGCLAHGDGTENFYRWKETIGPVEQRRGQRNIWGYHQSVGLGYFEYFQFCEDIGAKPLPVVAAGVSCQNSDYCAGTGQECLPMQEMPAYIQDILDLIEWANGPATSPWGSKRAAAGHPEPFHLQYLGVGNEDHITPGFKERFAMIHDAIKEKHPEITLIGTVGPSWRGGDFDAGWKFATERKLPMVDEHCYEKPDWFWTNLNRYDCYDRTRPKVYIGEYAAHDDRRRTTLRSALAEAAYLTSLERNGDVVLLSSYAPLLGKRGHTQWNPDLIYFTNTRVAPTINYYVQQLFARNAGDIWFPTRIDDGAAGKRLAASAVRDSRTGDLILKLVNGDAAPCSLQIGINGVKGLLTKATQTVLTGEPMAENTLESANPLLPQSATILVAECFGYEAPAHSLTVIRIPAQPQK